MPSPSGFDPWFLNQVPVPCGVYELETREFTANEAFLSLFGFGPERATGLRAAELLYEDDSEFTLHLVDELISGRLAEAVTMARYIHSDGSIFWAKSTRRLYRDDAGKPIAIISSLTELPLPDSVLDDIVAPPGYGQETLVASVGHELRSPIHGIIGLAELLADAGDLSTANQQLASAIRDQALAVSRLIDDLLDYSKVRPETVRLAPSEISPEAIAKRVIALVTPEAVTKGLELSLVVEPAAPASIVTDGLRIAQILTNLVTNAVRYSEVGTVTIQLDAPAPQEFCIRITDNGPGIDPELLPGLFEPFVQGHTRHTGSGLGLAITKRLVDALGGSIDVESTNNEGTTFRVVLPIGQGSSGASPSPTTASVARRSDHGRNYVLVVEDETVNQLLATSQLTKLGYRAQVTESGTEAIELLEKGVADGDPFHAVLMDWHLPGIDGIETTKRLRLAEAEWNHDLRLPVIGVTANAMPGDRELCLDAGMDHVLTKPVSIARLGDALDVWVCPIDPEVEGPLLDTSVLATLADELGDVTAVDTLLATFLNELSGRLEPLELALGGDHVESKDLRRAAHSLKATSALIGSPLVSKACAFVETFIDEHEQLPDPRAADNWYRAMLVLVRRLEVEVWAEVSTTSKSDAGQPVGSTAIR